MDDFTRQMLGANMMSVKGQRDFADADMWRFITPPENIFEKTAAKTVGPVRERILDSNDRRKELMVQYNDALVEAGMVLTRSRLKELDTIDLRPLLALDKDDRTAVPQIPVPDGWHDFIKEYGMYACIPCFKEAVIRFNTGRYLHYKLTDVNMENKTFTVCLHDYIAYPGNFSTGVYGTMDFVFTDDSFVESRAHDDVMLFSDIYRSISCDRLGWNGHDKKLWNDVIVKFADEITRKLHEMHQTNQFQELCKLFISLVTVTNLTLANNRVKRPKKPKTTVSTKRETVKAQTVPPEKLVRKVGMISVKSEKPPKMPSEKTIVHYRLASWKAKGYIRTLKSGKKIYVGESVRHRHCLNQEEHVPVNVLKFKNK